MKTQRWRVHCTTSQYWKVLQWKNFIFHFINVGHSNEKATPELQAGALYPADLSYDNSEQTKHRGRREKGQVLSSAKKNKILQAGEYWKSHLEYKELSLLARGCIKLLYISRLLMMISSTSYIISTRLLLLQKYQNNLC